MKAGHSLMAGGSWILGSLSTTGILCAGSTFRGTMAGWTGPSIATESSGK